MLFAQGHVKRTIQAFNEYSTTSQVSAETGAGAVSSSKPPSPSPRRQKTQPSPVMSRKTPTPQQPQRPQQTSYTSQQQQQSYNTSYSSSTQMMSSDTRQELSPPPSHPRDQEQPSYYTKYSSAAPSSPLPTSVAFPNHQPRSGTPQSPPKRVEELMSEFQEFDTGPGSVSPTPAMFSRPQVEVSELPDGPPQSHHIKLQPQPKVRQKRKPNDLYSLFLDVATPRSCFSESEGSRGVLSSRSGVHKISSGETLTQCSFLLESPKNGFLPGESPGSRRRQHEPAREGAGREEAQGAAA